MTTSTSRNTSSTTSTTSKDRLIADGGSAGGLLMGAIAACALTSSAPSSPTCPSWTSSAMMDASLPLTAQEWRRWGVRTIPPNTPAHEIVLAVRQHHAQGVPVDARDDLFERLRGDVLGAGEMGGQAACLNRFQSGIKINMAGGHGFFRTLGSCCASGRSATRSCWMRSGWRNSEQSMAHRHANCWQNGIEVSTATEKNGIRDLRGLNHEFLVTTCGNNYTGYSTGVCVGPQSKRTVVAR